MALDMLAFDEQRVALSWALAIGSQQLLPEPAPAELDHDEKPSTSSPTQVAMVKEFMEGDDDTAFAEDYFSEHSARPADGCLLELELLPSELEVGLAISDAAQWSVPEVGATQESFCHAGYRGTVAGLLQKAAKDIEMMRGGYSADQQHLFDRFLGQVEGILDGATSSVSSERGGVKMVIRDPSGLSGVAAEPVDWVQRSAFRRSFREVQALGLEEATFSVVPPERQLRTSDAIAGLVRDARRVVAFTGAGVSVESGITPFRTYGPQKGGEKGSIWGTFDAGKMTSAGFNKDPECTKAWWRMKHSLYREFEGAKPNPAHDFFAKLERDGKLAGVVTQNIDSLHTRAGVPPEKVLEIHGHMRGLICSDKISDLNPLPFKQGTCSFEMTDAEARRRRYFADEELPLCPVCACPLRTQTVMFGQPMPNGAVQRAGDLIAAADLLVVIGSTLIVEPANELPGVALLNGCPLVIINFDDTSYDKFATGLVRQPAGAFLADVTAKLGR